MFFKNVAPKESFFIVASDVVPILYNKSFMYWRLISFEEYFQI